MIEWAYVVENDELRLFYFECLECTERFGHPVRMVLNGTAERAASGMTFNDVHESCGPGYKFVTYDLTRQEVRKGRFVGPAPKKRSALSERNDAIFERMDMKEECPSLWTKEAETQWNLDVKIIKSIYADNPGIGFADMRVIYDQRKKDLEEMR